MEANGVRQEALPDSPVVFAALTALKPWTMHSASIQAGGITWPPLPLNKQATLSELETELSRHGLVINPEETAIIYSQATGERAFSIDGKRVECLP